MYLQLEFIQVKWTKTHEKKYIYFSPFLIWQTSSNFFEIIVWNYSVKSSYETGEYTDEFSKKICLAP